MTNKFIFFSVLALTVCLLAESASAASPDRRDSFIPPSVSSNGVNRPKTMSVGYFCYSYRTGQPRNCSLRFHFLSTVDESVRLGIKSEACEYDAEGFVVPNTCASGGHNHVNSGDATRPQTRIYIPPVDRPAAELNKSQPLSSQSPLVYEETVQSGFPDFEVSGDVPTNTWVFVDYEAPDAAGSAYWTSQMDPPACSFLARFCGFIGIGAQPDGSMLMDGTVTTRIPDLRRLPDLPDVYRKFRNGFPVRDDPDDTRHLDADAFSATQRTIDALRLISLRHKIRTNALIRPNDLSLPLGGLFDIRAQYNFDGGHSTHREGEDIDLNRAIQRLDANGNDAGDPVTVECENDTDLFEAVNAVLLPWPGRVPRKPTEEDEGFMLGPGGTLPEKATALLCEKTSSDPLVFGRKHIDVIRIIFPGENQ